MDYTEVLTAVIRRERSIIGRIAVRRAKELGISVSDSVEARIYKGEGREILSELLNEYESITGPSAFTIAARAISELFGGREKIPEEIEKILK